MSGAMTRMSDIVRVLAGYVKQRALTQLFTSQSELSGKLAVDHIVPIAYLAGDAYPIRLSVRVEHTEDGKRKISYFYTAESITVTQLLEGADTWGSFLQPKAVSLVDDLVTLLNGLTDPELTPIINSGTTQAHPQMRRFYVS